MPACRICQHTFTSLRFQNEHIAICTRCVNTLNESPEPAKNAEARFAEKLARGMLRNAEHDLKSGEEWKRRKAQQTLSDLDTAVAAKLHDWMTQLLANPSNSTRDFKIMRAHRRGLLRMEGLADYKDRNWKEVAQKIRRRDGYKCMVCGATSKTLDVHHIIYLSHHGTNQQYNLITLCRKCHEAEHDRVFDFPESQALESEAPIQPPHNSSTLQRSLISDDGNRQPLEDGPVESRANAAAGGAISERAKVSVGQGAHGVQQFSEQAPSAPQKSEVSVANGEPANSLSSSVASGRGPSPMAAPPPKREVPNRLADKPAVRTPHASWNQERVRTASNAKRKKWGVIISGIIFCIAMNVLIISLLQR